jgi:hypothetical protein
LRTTVHEDRPGISSTTGTVTTSRMAPGNGTITARVLIGGHVVGENTSSRSGRDRHGVRHQLTMIAV